MKNTATVRRQLRVWLLSTLLVNNLALAGGVVTCHADLDKDGEVAFFDLVSLLSAWGGTWGPSDLDADCNIGATDLVMLLANWGPCGSECPGGFESIAIDESIDVCMGDFVHTVDLAGALSVSAVGLANGDLTAGFSDGSGAVITVIGNAVTVTTDGGMLDLNVAGEAGTLIVDGAPIAVSSALDAFMVDVVSPAPGTWTPSSRASLALAALGTHHAWTCNARAAMGIAPLEVDFWCKAAAYSAATVVAGLAASGCFVLTGGCAVGSTVTIGGLAVPCTVLIGLCAGGAFAGTAAAYEAMLALWGC